MSHMRFILKDRPAQVKSNNKKNPCERNMLVCALRLNPATLIDASSNSDLISYSESVVLITLVLDCSLQHHSNAFFFYPSPLVLYVEAIIWVK